MLTENELDIIKARLTGADMVSAKVARRLLDDVLQLRNKVRIEAAASSKGKWQEGERMSVLQVLNLGRQYGYGNMIAWLKHGWAKELKFHNSQLSFEQALRFTEVDAYPENQWEIMDGKE